MHVHGDNLKLATVPEAAIDGRVEVPRPVHPYWEHIRTILGDERARDLRVVDNVWRAVLLAEDELTHVGGLISA